MQTRRFALPLIALTQFSGVSFASTMTPAILQPPASTEKVKKQVQSPLAKETDRPLPPLSPLFGAVAVEDAARLDALLRSGADPNARDREDETPLMRAAERNNFALVGLLLANKADINARNSRGETALMQAALGGYQEAMKRLLDKGADVNLTDNAGRSALIWAASQQREELLKPLLDKGANPNVKEKEGYTACSWLALNNSKQPWLKLLLDRKADPNIGAAEGHAPLMEAADMGATENVRLLLARGANKNAADKNGYTPLLKAINGSQSAVVGILVDAGIDVNARYSEGIWSMSAAGKDGLAYHPEKATALMLAASLGEADVVSALLDKGADVNATDNHGMTALMWAAVRGKILEVDRLRRYQYRLESDKPPTFRENLDVVKLLLLHGAKVNVVDTWGNTALTRAQKSKAEAIVKALVAAGAK